MRLVHSSEQSIKNPEQEDKFGRANQFRDNAQAEKPLRSEDVVGVAAALPDTIKLLGT